MTLASNNHAVDGQSVPGFGDNQNNALHNLVPRNGSASNPWPVSARPGMVHPGVVNWGSSSTLGAIPQTGNGHSYYGGGPGTGPAAPGSVPGSGGGASIIVTDGVHTVNPTTTIDFTSGAVVTNAGGGTAAVAASGTGITQLTGDVTAGPGSGSQVATLATVNTNVGSFTNTSLTTNAKGLITAASNGSSAPPATIQSGQTATGTNQGTAFALTADWTEFTMVAAGTGAILTASVGKAQTITNSGSNNLLVYPESGSQINNLGANNPYTLGPASTGSFRQFTATQVYSQP